MGHSLDGEIWFGNTRKSWSASFFMTRLIYAFDGLAADKVLPNRKKLTAKEKFKLLMERLEMINSGETMKA